MRGLDRLEARVVVALLIVGAALRLFIVPPRLVMVYAGYQIAHSISNFAMVGRWYGASTLVLYRAFYALFGHGHETMILVNSALGILGIAALLALLARLSPPRGAVAAAALALALLPAFLKDHRSESILVPTAFFLWCALLLWDRWLAGRARLDGVGAVILAALAFTCRPEMVAVVPLALCALAWVRGARPRDLFLPLAALLALGVPHLVGLRAVVASEVAHNLLPAFDANLPWRSVWGLFSKNLVFRPLWFPAAVSLAAIAALALSRGPLRRAVVALWVLALAWIGCYFMDLPEVSIPRLHAPGAALLTLAAAIGAARILELAGARRRPAAIALGLVTLASAAPSAAVLWDETNEDEEERLIADAVKALPAGNVCLVRIGGEDDPPASKTNRSFPDYLLRPPHRDDRIYDIHAWETRRAAECPDQAYAYLGTRCYASFRRHDAPPRQGEPIVAACARLRANARLDPVLERTVRNHGNPDDEWDYYPPVPEMRIGLYRIVKD